MQYYNPSKQTQKKVIQKVIQVSSREPSSRYIRYSFALFDRKVHDTFTSNTCPHHQQCTDDVTHTPVQFPFTRNLHFSAGILLRYFRWKEPRYPSSAWCTRRTLFFKDWASFHSCTCPIRPIIHPDTTIVRKQSLNNCLSFAEPSFFNHFAVPQVDIVLLLLWTHNLPQEFFRPRPDIHLRWTQKPPTFFE